MRHASHDSGYQPPERPIAHAPIDQPHARARLAQELRNMGISNARVLAAMKTVPRHLFVSRAWAHHAYQNMPLPIGLGQTISQPFVVARMLEALELAPGMRVLEIGMGSGYQTALLAALGCEVYAIERLAPLYDNACARFRKMGLRSIHPYRCDGTLGLPLAAPFDRIVVAAGSPAVPPPLLAQLEDDGIMIIPVGPAPRSQRLTRLRKKRGRLESEDLGGADFVNLVGDHGWKSGRPRLA